LDQAKDRELGVEASEMAATSSFMIVMTTSINSIQFMARGTLAYSDFGIYTAFGFVSFFIGVNVLRVIIRKTNNRAIILFVLAAAIALSAVLMSYLGGTNIVQSLKNKAYMGFGRFCPRK
jgi:uncharacterized membrane protein YfcA